MGRGSEIREYWNDVREARRNRPRDDDDDLGSLYRSMRETAKEEKSARRTAAPKILQDHGVEYRKFSDDHFRIG